MNCFCKMIDKQLHYYEKQGNWDQLNTGSKYLQNFHLLNDSSPGRFWHFN